MTAERRAPVDTAVDEGHTRTDVGALDEAATEFDGPGAPPASVRYPAGPVNWRRRAVIDSLAWPALLIVAVRIAGGLLLERAALGLFGFVSFPPVGLRPENGSIVSGFIRWDAAIYMRIAQHGYVSGYKDDPAFYPLYPYLARALSHVTPLSLDQAALAVSWISLWMAVWGVMRLTRLIFPDTNAWRAGALLAFFPVSVFLLAGYPESLYMALFAWSLVALLEGRPWLAATLAAFVAITRLEGVLLVLAIVGWAVQDEVRHQQRPAGRAIARIAGLCAVSLTPLFAYLLFIWRRYGDFFQPLSANKAWHRHLSWPLHPLFASISLILGNHIHGRTAANYVATYLVDDAAVVLAIIGLAALCVIVWRQRDLWWLVPPVLVALLIIVSDPSRASPEAWGRNVMVLVPLYAVASRIKSEVTWSMLLAGSALMAALFQIMFNVGLWLT